MGNATKKIALLTYLFSQITMLAQANEVKPYIAIGGAAAIAMDDLSVQNNSRGYYNISRKSALMHRLAVGAPLGKDSRWEVELLNFAKYKVYWNFQDDPKIGAEAKLHSQSYYLNFYYDFKNLSQIATMYVGGGIGASYNSVNKPSLSDGRKVARNAEYDFAWNMGFGAIHHINEDFYVDANYRYLYSGKFKSNSITNDANKPLLRGKVNNHMFLVSFAVKI
jgi:opacity protein-like surface antigen